MKRARLWIALFSVAAVMLVAVVDTRRTSPGSLASVHQRESGLADDCSACHGGWFSDMTDACLECHERIGSQIEAGEGLHGRLEDGEASRCSQCHSEHHGSGFAVVNKQSFAFAGVPDPESFDHSLVGFVMEGRHLEIDCRECHENSRDAVLGKGEQRFGGLDPSCVACHEDVHEGSFVLSCTSCHGQQTWDGLRSVGHEQRLPLVGGHADVACRECHAEDEPHSLELLGSGRALPAPRACVVCHESPHETAFVAVAAGLASMEPAAGCVVCHEADHDSFRERDLTVTAEQHASTGFALELPHQEAKCVECHDPGLAKFRQRYPDRSPDRCSACHDDPHGGQFRAGPFAGGDCVACHERARFEPHAFGPEEHALTSLPLTGRHAEAECNDCHVDPHPDGPTPGNPRKFRGTAGSCGECHADAHDGFFEDVALELVSQAPADCSACHGTTTFSDVAAERFDHATWTGFAVLGAHAQSGCEACHAPADEPDESGRRFGRVAEHFGEFTGCVTCHEDPHRGAFDRPGRPHAVEGRTDCARCHVESSFRVLVGFDHELWTGYALAGAHAQIDCSACHAPLREPDDEGRTWMRADGRGCADCHADPHAGQFAEPDRSGKTSSTDCARCHAEDEPELLSFDHERDSTFSLRPAHVELECSACHLPERIGAAEAIRYRPLGSSCVDCHGVDEDVLLLKRPRKR